MSSSQVIYVNGTEHSCADAQVTVATILEEAGTTIKESVLVSADGVTHEDPQELIELEPGARFCTTKREDITKLISYFVNGEPCTTTENPISVETILRNAGKGAAIDLRDLGSYILENIADGRKYQNLDDLVEICEGDNFIAIHVGSTPVA